jgi:GNAT superfamily N-acetyltransferase
LWTDCDANSDREISQAIYPEYREDPHHPAWFSARQLGAPREWSSRYVAVETHNDQRVAYATLWELRPRRYRFDLAVRPEWQEQGIGTKIFVQVMRDAEALGATGLQARVRDDKHKALEFISHRGFCESHRMGAYRLNFTEVEVS